MSALFPRAVAERWIGLEVRQLRADILNGTRSPSELREHLRTRDGGQSLALRLSQDDDPRVRAAVIETLASLGRPAEKHEAADRHLPGNTFSNPDVAEAFDRLLNDPDPMVRRTAIRAVSSIEEVRSFQDRMLRILETGPVEERLIVAEHLAHWNGAEARRTFAQPRQPKEVRLAALRSAERYGWALIVEPDSEVVRTMNLMQVDPDAELRQAATTALTHRLPERGR